MQWETLCQQIWKYLYRVDSCTETQIFGANCSQQEIVRNKNLEKRETVQMFELEQPPTFLLVSSSSALLAETPAEQTGEISRLQAFYQGCLPDPGVSEQFDLYLVDGTGGGYELLNVLLGPPVPLEHAEEVPQGGVPLDPGADLGRDSLPVGRVNACPG